MGRHLFRMGENQRMCGSLNDMEFRAGQAATEKFHMCRGGDLVTDATQQHYRILKFTESAVTRSLVFQCIAANQREQ